MRCSLWTLSASLILISVSPLLAQRGGQAPADDAASILVSRLELESYKATIKGLTQFGDRRDGTQRNRDAVDWIAAQLESYGYTTVERLQYDAPQPRQRGNRGGGRRGGRGRGRGRGRRGQGGAERRVPAGTPDDPTRRGRAA